MNHDVPRYSGVHVSGGSRSVLAAMENLLKKPVTIASGTGLEVIIAGSLIKGVLHRRWPLSQLMATARSSRPRTVGKIYRFSDATVVFSDNTDTYSPKPNAIVLRASVTYH